MEHPEYLEHQEGPDGQCCDLLTRVPYERQRALEINLRNGRNAQDQDDAALRAFLWRAADVDEYHVGCKPNVKHDLTGDFTDDLGKASLAVIQPWRERASELYNAWFEAAMPSQKKGSGRTGRSTRTGSPRSATKDAT